MFDLPNHNSSFKNYSSRYKESHRSNDSDMQIEPYYGDFRCYSTSSSAVTPYYQTPPQKLKKEKRCWSFNDPEMQRIVSYKTYTVQPKLLQGAFDGLKIFSRINNHFSPSLFFSCFFVFCQAVLSSCVIWFYYYHTSKVSLLISLACRFNHQSWDYTQNFELKKKQCNSISILS